MILTNVHSAATNFGYFPAPTMFRAHTSGIVSTGTDTVSIKPLYDGTKGWLGSRGDDSQRCTSAPDAVHWPHTGVVGEFAEDMC
jgi:hypothetical protein